MLLLLGLVLFGIIVLHVVMPKTYHWPSTWRKLNKIPGPPSVPFFGNTFSFLVKNEDFLPLLMKFSDKYGPIWRMSMQGTLFVFLTDFNDIEEKAKAELHSRLHLRWGVKGLTFFELPAMKKTIVTWYSCIVYILFDKVILNSKSRITKGEDYEFLIPWLGTGLLISSGKKWADHRKWLTPAFHFTILEKQYMDIMKKNAKTLVKILRSHEEGFHVEINPLISHCTLDIICETAMGAQVNALLGGEKDYVKSVIRMSQIFTQRLLSPWLYRPCIFHMTPLGREHDRVLKIVHGFTQKVIKERQAAFREKRNAKQQSEQDHDHGTGEKKKISFLDLLIEISETQNLLTQEEIQEEVDTFMFEGHDTTAAAICWALYELGRHAEIQEKAYQEQCEVLGDTDREPTFADLQEMKYLERVIKETLRLYPSVPIISRKMLQDVKIRNYVIPADTQVPIFIYYIHKNPKLYPEPNKFNPDRFLPDLLRDRHPYSYVPFSAGPRNCIGQRFAMMEEKIVLSHIIRNFKFTNVTKPENIKIMGELILRPKDNIKMTFTPRSRN